MKMNRVKAIGIGVLALGILQSASAYSAMVTGTLEYVEPTGTVNANETINVRVRLTLGASSAPLTYTIGSYPNGINPADIPTSGYSNSHNSMPFAGYDYIGHFTSRDCDDTFTDGCGGGSSQYESIAPASDSWFDFNGITIGAGESREFNLFQWKPTDGSAESGTYRLFTAGLGFTVYGWGDGGIDEDSNPIQIPIDAEIYNFNTNCIHDSCAFTRTVSAVPLPAAAWLFGSALLGLIGVAKRKKA